MLLAFKEKLKEVSGGFALVVLIAIASNFLSDQYNAPVILFALLIGIAFNFLNNCTPYGSCHVRFKINFK